MEKSDLDLDVGLETCLSLESNSRVAIYLHKRFHPFLIQQLSIY